MKFNQKSKIDRQAGEIVIVEHLNGEREREKSSIWTRCFFFKKETKTK